MAAVLVAVSVGRGLYVGFVEHPQRPVLAVNLPADDWTTALRWVADHTPSDAFVLADPGHAWKFGTAVRIGARRDVYLEETKDVAMAMYSLATATRVLAADRPRRRLRGPRRGHAAASWPAAKASPCW